MDDKIGNTPIYIHDCLCKQVPKHPILSHVAFYYTFDILFFLLIEIFNIFQPHPTLPNQTYPSVYPFYFIGNIEIFRLKICDSTFTRLFCSTHNFHFTLTLLFPNIEFTFLCVWFSFDFVFTFKYLKWKCNNHIRVKVFLRSPPTLHLAMVDWILSDLSLSVRVHLQHSTGTFIISNIYVYFSHWLLPDKDPHLQTKRDYLQYIRFIIDTL